MSRAQQAQHGGGCSNEGQRNHSRSPKKLLACSALVMERKPVPDETGWNAEYDSALAWMMGFVIGEHRPYIR